VNLFHFSILAIRKAGVRRFFEIVVVKARRHLFEGRVDKRIQNIHPAGQTAFDGVIPLDPSTAQRFRNIFPAVFPDFLSRAQKIRSHNFQLLGASFECGEKIDWHRDPVSKKTWQKKTYREISIYYEGSPADVKPVWELNRHQHFVTLAQAYSLSGDRTYADELESQWLDWIKENPYRVGINWASPLEVGLRLISWTLAFQFIEAHLTKEVRSTITSSIAQQASFLASHLSVDKIVRTNHLIGETAGLFITAASFSFEGSKQWMQAARGILEKEIQAQIFDDGAGKEQSAAYHRFDTELLLLAFIKAQKKSFPFSPLFAERLQKMLRCLYRFKTPTCEMPPFGDSDDGRGFSLSPSLNFRDVRGLIALGGFALNIEELSIPAFLNEESFWFFTEREWTSAKEKRTNLLSGNCVVSRESGHVVIRNAETDGMDYCFFRAGPFGLGGDGFCSHSHNDLFSPILYIHGESILADTGTSVYLGNDPERDYLRSAEAHNTTVSPGWNFFKSQKWFGWKKVVDGRIIREDQTSQEISVECGFDEAAGIPYSRTIVYRPHDHSFRIEDRFDEDVRGVHSYFHLDPSLTIEKGIGDIALVKNNNRIVRCSYSDMVKPEIEEGWISKGYGIKERAMIIHFVWNAAAKQPMNFTFAGIDR